MRLLPGFVVLWLLVAVADVGAQVACTSPDDLCTGDPCVIGTLAVQTPCILDFGNRTVEIAGTVAVPDDGTFEISALDVLVSGRIDGRHVDGAGNGADVVLAAMHAVQISGAIDVGGSTTSGTIAVGAWQYVEVMASATVEAQGIGIPGGEITIGGSATVSIAGLVRAQGTSGGAVFISSSFGPIGVGVGPRVDGADAGGTVWIQGYGNVVVADAVRANGKAGMGGSILVSSHRGSVDVNDSLDVRGASGGSIHVVSSAPTEFPVTHVNVRGKLTAKGSAGNGGLVMLRGRRVDSFAAIDVDGKGGDGGAVTVDAVDHMVLHSERSITATGTLDGGTISALTTDGATHCRSKLTARGRSGNGGTLTVSSPNRVAGLAYKIDLRGRTGGGRVELDALEVDFRRVRIRLGGTGGEVRVNQTGSGTLFVEDVKVDARTSGTVTIAAPAADLIVRGRFFAGPTGCIAMSSGGVTDTAGVSSDVALTATCP